MADKYLIINADDFGMCGAANAAVMDLFKSGRLKSSTIMMPCKFAKEAVQFSIDNPQYAIGVHLTTTSEWANYNWGPITDLPSLKNEKGFMWPECEDFAQHADLEEARKEILAQVKLAESMGMKPSHLDNHMGSLYGIEGGNFKLLPMTMKLCGELGYAFRMCRKPLKTECPEGTPYFLYAIACKICDYLGKKNNVIMPDYLIFPKWNDEMRTSYERYREMFLEDLCNIPAGFSETYVHPSMECDEIKGITGRWRDRVWEYQIMKDPKTEQHLNAHGIELISYRDMIEMKK